jgi:hypothetical protein
MKPSSGRNDKQKEETEIEIHRNTDSIKGLAETQFIHSEARI